MFLLVRGLFDLWQVLDSNQRRLQPTILQTAPFGRSGNLPCRVEFHPAAGRNNTQLPPLRANHLQSQFARFGTMARADISEME